MYALIRSVASIRAKLGAEMYQKWAKQGVNFIFGAFGAKIFKRLPLFGCCLYWDTTNLAQKRCLYLGCYLYLSKKKIEVYALIRSVAFIGVLGGTPFLSTFWPFWAKVAQTGEFL